MCPTGRRLINGEGGWFAPGKLVCHCLLIESREGLILVDTGFGAKDIEDPQTRLGPIRGLLKPTLQPSETALALVQNLGFRPSDVRHVLLTHLDLDHAGGLADFPNATIHLLAAEKHHAIDAPDRASKRRYRSIQWDHEPKWATYEPDGTPWKGFAAARELRGLPPEILLVPMAGHTQGHACIAVEGESDWMLHCGDAYFHRHSLVGEKPPFGIRMFQRLAALNTAEMLANQARLQELKATESDVTLFCSHDPVELAERTEQT